MIWFIVAVLTFMDGVVHTLPLTGDNNIYQTVEDCTHAISIINARRTQFTPTPGNPVKSLEFRCISERPNGN